MPTSVEFFQAKPAKRIFSTLMLGCAAFLIHGQAVAGFEWVPSPQAVKAPTQNAVTSPGAIPAPAVEIAPLNESDQAVLPMPALPGSNVPQISQNSVQQAPQAVQQPAPQAPPYSAEVQQGVNQPPQARQQAPVVKTRVVSNASAHMPQAQEQVIHRKTLYPSEQPTHQNIEPPLPPIETTSAQNQTKSLPPIGAVEPAKPVVKTTVTAETIHPQTKVVMSENAPESAIGKLDENINYKVDVKQNAQASMLEKAGSPSLKISTAPNLTDAAPVQKPAPLSQANMDLQDLAQMPAIGAVESEGTDKVEGFGSDVPLAIALQQILPADYTVSFGSNINPGSKVSWSGGASWIQTLQGMIAPLSLSAHVKGNKVYIMGERQTLLNTEMAAQQAAMIDSAAGHDSAIMGQDDQALAAQLNAIETATGIPSRAIVQDPGEATKGQPSVTVKKMQQKVSLDRKPKPLVVQVSEHALKVTLSEDDQNTINSVAVPAAGSDGVWEARKGESLKETISAWAKVSGYDVNWEAEHDYILSSNIAATGQFDEALKALAVNGLEGEIPAISILPAHDSKSAIVNIRQPQTAS